MADEGWDRPEEPRRHNGQDGQDEGLPRRFPGFPGGRRGRREGVAPLQGAPGWGGRFSQGFTLGRYGLPLQGCLGMMLAAWWLGRWRSRSSPGCEAILGVQRGLQKDRPPPAQQRATAHAEFARLAVILFSSETRLFMMLGALWLM